MGISQDQFNELVYLALQIHLAETQARTSVQSKHSDSSYGEFVSFDKEHARFAQQLFCARFNSVAHASVASHFYHRFKHFSTMLPTYAYKLGEITSGVLTNDLQTTVMDYMSVIAQADGKKSQERETRPLSVLNTAYVKGAVIQESPPSKADDMNTIRHYKQTIVDQLNRQFNSQFDFTYVGIEKPWLIHHFFDIYGPEIIVSATIALAAYLFNPISLLSRMAVLNFIPKLVGASSGPLLLYGFYQRELPIASEQKYLFNPHRHVKIGLSDDLSIFLSQQNQSHLETMRTTNPNDDIHLIYAKQLLSDEALQGLKRFCKVHHITPVCIEEEILPNCLDNALEKQLVELYQQEIQSLDQSGSLAVAANILYWLKPVYSLGTCSNFDVLINTSKIPLKIVTQEAMILNMGSVTASVTGVEALIVNNDIISIVDVSGAAEMIRSIQMDLIASCTNPSRFKQQFDRTVRAAMDAGLSSGEVNQDPNQVTMKILCYIESIYPTNNMPLFRDRITALTKSNQSFLDLMSIALSDQIVFINGDIKAYFINTSLQSSEALEGTSPITSMDEDKIITTIRERYQTLCVKLSDMYTTGSAILLAPFKEFYRATEIEQSLSRFSLPHYQLDKAVDSSYVETFHATPLERTERMVKKTTYSKDILLELGQSAPAVKETFFNKSAATLQQLFKKVIFSEREEDLYHDPSRQDKPK